MYTKKAPKHIFLKEISKEHFPQPPQKKCAMKFSPLKKHAPHQGRQTGEVGGSQPP